MRSKTTLAIAACLALWSSGCATRYAKPTPPSELAVKCPAIPDLRDGEGDTVGRWAGEVVEWGRDCRTRHNRLVDWLEK